MNIAYGMTTLIARLKKQVYGSCVNAAHGCNGIRKTNGYCGWCYVRGLYSRVQYHAWVNN